MHLMVSNICVCSDILFGPMTDPWIGSSRVMGEKLYACCDLVLHPFVACTFPS